MKQTKITIKKSTLRKLAKITCKNQTWDSKINELIQHVNACDKYWMEK